MVPTFCTFLLTSCLYLLYEAVRNEWTNERTNEWMNEWRSHFKYLPASYTERDSTFLQVIGYTYILIMQASLQLIKLPLTLHGVLYMGIYMFGYKFSEFMHMQMFVIMQHYLNALSHTGVSIRVWRAHVPFYTCVFCSWKSSTAIKKNPGYLTIRFVLFI